MSSSMERAIVKCSCGVTYNANIMHMTLTMNPPVFIERAEAPCPACGLLYEKREQAEQLPPRVINLT